MPQLHFDNRFIRELPADPAPGGPPRQVAQAYALVPPTPVAAPRLVAHSAEMARTLGLSEADVASKRFAQVFSGNLQVPGMQTWAANYGGHQFGVWAGQLGDGRAISLGELINAQGQRWELQLKGAGTTPFSRGADGRAVLRSSIREFLCSEAMHHLGVPTTRALSVVATGEAVVRDMFYDGHPREEPGAIVCRCAPSFIRFGNFELPGSRGDAALLKRLVDFTIQRDFPELEGEGEALYAEWFGQVCERTARMVAQWMRVGFVHGVMNTDNMSILGLTIDYGPYGWIDNFDLDWTPNTTDATYRRYRFGHQPSVAWWNLSRLAGALSSLFTDMDLLRHGLDRFMAVYTAEDRRHTAGKLGLAECRDDDVELMAHLQQLLQEGEVDMTLFFRALSAVDPYVPSLEPFREAFYDEGRYWQVEAGFLAWLARYTARLVDDPLSVEERTAVLHAANPRFVLRNYLVQEAIEQAEQGDDALVRELLDVMRRPYDEQPGRERFARKRPDWARAKPGCSTLSCSS